MHDTNHPEQSEKRASFAVKDCALIAIATGNSAITLKEFRDALATVDIDSIYYHFWGGLLQPRFEEREYNNDFAAWSWYSLHDAPLAERLAVVDPTEFVTLEDLRRELVEIIEERFDENEYAPWLRADSPFEFIRSQIVVFDTRKRAATPRELATLLPTVSAGSIFYHFIDARRRLSHHGDDLSFWLNDFGEEYRVLRDRLTGFDPYFSSLNQLKKQLVTLFDQYFTKETS